MTRIPRARVLAASAVAAAVLIAGVAVAPWGPRLAPRTGTATATSADDRLAASVRAVVGEQGSAFDGQRYHHLVVIGIDGERTSTAAWGATARTEFEIGSVTKTFTASLFAAALARGEVTADQRLGTLLDLGSSPASRVTLGELASQRSGLPVQPADPAAVGRNLWGSLTASDPFQVPLSTLLDEARQATVTDRGSYRYSNLGVALLGQALAAAAKTDYRSLLTERVITPLGLDATSLPEYSSRLESQAPRGFTAAGRPTGEWTLGPFAPAGGVRSTGEDMARFVRAVLDGSAPGTAVDPGPGRST